MKNNSARNIPILPKKVHLVISFLDFYRYFYPTPNDAKIKWVNCVILGGIIEKGLKRAGERSEDT
jgi:hypothetical protein